MDPISATTLTGIVLGALPLVPGVQLLEVFQTEWDRLRDMLRKDGLIALMLFYSLPGTYSAIERIESVLSGTNRELSEFRQSLSSNINMVAVAVAIIAQVAVTGLSLGGIDQAHWTAAVFLIASLVLGIVTVYVCFVVQQELNGLLGPVGFTDWLSRPLTMEELSNKAYSLSLDPAFFQERTSSGNSPVQVQVTGSQENGPTSVHLKREVSVLATIMVATPSGLLGLSLNRFLAGLSIYLVCVYINDLVPGYSRGGGSLGILVFYVVAASVAIVLYSIPQLLKGAEARNAKKTSGLAAQQKNLAEAMRKYRERREAEYEHRD